MFRNVDRRAYRRRLRVAVVAAALVTLAVSGPLAAPADAQVLPPSLAGESFFAVEQDPNTANVGEVNVSFSCGFATGSEFTISYTASGPATGPYPGTFTESGSITGTIKTVAFGVASGTVATWNASFTIDSFVGQVTGTKFVTAQFNTVNQSTCQGFSTLFRGITASRSLAYQATIETNTGTFTDQGQSSALVHHLTCNPGVFPGCVGQVQSSESFSEQFISSTGVAPVGPASVVLTPPTAINTVGTSHTVTATVTDASALPQGFAVNLPASASPLGSSPRGIVGIPPSRPLQTNCDLPPHRNQKDDDDKAEEQRRRYDDPSHRISPVETDR